MLNCQSKLSSQITLPRRVKALWDYLACALGIAVFVWFAPLSQPPQMSADVESYVSLAKTIYEGRLFQKVGDKERDIGVATRTPGYPAMLAFANLFSDSLRTQMLIVHLGLACCALFIVPLLLRSYLPVILTEGALLLVLHGMRDYFSWPITEWATFIFLLFLFAFSVRFFETKSYGWGVAAFICVPILIFLRPAMLVVFIFFLPALFLISNLRILAVIFLTSIAPLVLWNALNHYRIGSATLTPALGRNIFGVATMLGDLSVDPERQDVLAQFARAVQGSKKRIAEIEKHPEQLSKFSRDAVNQVYASNILDVGGKAAATLGLGMVEENKLMLDYSLAVIQQYPMHYFWWVVEGLRTLDATFELLPFCLLVPIVWMIRYPCRRALAISVFMAMLAHVCHIALCASVEVVIERYNTLTFQLLLFASVVAAAVLVSDVCAGMKRNSTGSALS